MFFALFSNVSLAEIYKDFLPYDSLAIIKTKYPNAKLEPIKAAWVKEDEAFIRLSGVGIVGTINLKFSTTDNFIKGLIKYNRNEIEKNPTSDNSKNEDIIKAYNDVLALPLDQKLTLDWLRWVSPTPLPFERLVSKYGNPEKCDYDPDTFSPYCAWISKGVSANLTDDKKYVDSIEYSFTDKDKGISNTEEIQNPEPAVKKKSPKKK